MRAKSETLQRFQQYEQDMSGLLRRANIKRVSVWGLQSDNGGE